MRSPVDRALPVMLALALALVGCGGDGGTPASSVAAASSPFATLAMHVSLPSGWQQVELTEAAIRDGIAAARSSSPALTDLLSRLLDSGQYKVIKLYAVGLSGATLIGNLVGTAIPVGPLDLDGLGPSLEATFRQMGGIDLALTRTTLPAGDALVIDLKLPIGSAAGAPTAQERVFNVVRDGGLYQLTFTCPSGVVTDCLAAAESTAMTLSIGR